MIGQKLYLEYLSSQGKLVSGKNIKENVMVHPSAIIDPTAEIGPNVVIGEKCVIEAGCRIFDSTIMS